VESKEAFSAELGCSLADISHHRNSLEDDGNRPAIALADDLHQRPLVLYLGSCDCLRAAYARGLYRVRRLFLTLHLHVRPCHATIDFGDSYRGARRLIAPAELKRGRDRGEYNRAGKGRTGGV